MFTRFDTVHELDRHPDGLTKNTAQAALMHSVARQKYVKYVQRLRMKFRIHSQSRPQLWIIITKLLRTRVRV